MQEERDIPNWVNKTEKPEVPKGFFEQFIERLMAIIEGIKSEDESSIGISATKKPEVPDGFFDSFADNLMAKIEDEEDDQDVLSGTILGQLKLAEKPEVPAGYFEGFAESVDQEDKSGGSIIPMWTKLTLVSAAAVVAFIFLVVNPNDNGSGEETNPVVAETSENSDEQLAKYADDEYVEYLAYMDDNEIIDYIVENEIEIDDEEVDLTEDEDYDYYLGDVEDLYMDMY